ncbi:MAG: ABC transporter ATP-binding protein [Parvularculales bacterium]
MAHLALRNISHRYGDMLAVDDVSLSLEGGHVLCLLGPSGGGKTTLLRIVAGLERQTAGEVLRYGELIADSTSLFVPPEKRNMGLMFQDYALFPHLNVFDNVAFGLRGSAAGEKRERVMTMLSHVGMTNFADAYPHRLSGGEQQRVALARALAPEPEIMLMDEPFSGLDRRLRNDIRDETLKMLKSAGVTTLLVTHDPEEAMRMGDCIALLHQGKLMQLGSPEVLFRTPATEEVAGFFSDFNTLNTIVKDSCVETPLGILNIKNFSDGTNLTLMVRQSALRLVSTDKVLTSHYDIEVEVVHTRFLGDYTLADVRIDDIVWQISLSRSSEIKAGERVRLALDPDEILMFEQEMA